MEITVDDIKPYVNQLSNTQKEKLIYQMLKKDSLLLEQLYFKHLANPEKLEERFANFENEVKDIVFRSFSARVNELAVAKAIGNAKKVINQFTKVDKRPEKEAALLMIILDAIFINTGNPARFGTCWTKYDLVVTQTLKRLITILRNKLHEDFLLDFKPQVDKYLVRMKSASSFNDFVYELPDEL